MKEEEKKQCQLSWKERNGEPVVKPFFDERKLSEMARECCEVLVKEIREREKLRGKEKPRKGSENDVATDTEA